MDHLFYSMFQVMELKGN